MSNQYKEAIETLQNLSSDQALDLIFKIAGSNPSAINKAMAETKPAPATSNPNLIQYVHDLIEASMGDTKISAIKAIRGITGLGLRESKYIADLHWPPTGM